MTNCDDYEYISACYKVRLGHPNISTNIENSDTFQCGTIRYSLILNEDEPDEKEIGYAEIIFAECDYMLIDSIDGDFINTLGGCITNKPFKEKYEECNLVFYISELFVEKEYRNRGYGSKLLNFIRDYVDSLYYSSVIILKATYLRDTGITSEKDIKKELKKNYKFYNKRGMIPVAYTTNESYFCWFGEYFNIDDIKEACTLLPCNNIGFAGTIEDKSPKVCISNKMD